ncbi:MAG: hypothetical protein QW840_04255, partial [Candidatus Bathyarchaeia archaeon]
MRKRIQDENVKVLVAEENGRIAGTVAYHDGFWGEEIEWLATRDALNRRELENLLVSEVEKFVKKGKILFGGSAEDL